MLKAMHQRAARAPLAPLVLTLLACVGLFLIREWLLEPAASPDGRLLGYSREDIADFMALAGPAGRRLYAWSALTLDLLFPVIVALALQRLLARTTWAAFGRHAMWLPAAAALADWGENALLAGMAADWWGLGVAPAASVLTRIKWALFTVSIALVVPGGVVALWRARGRLGTYVPYAYLLRVPLLLGLTLLLLPLLAMGGLRNVLGNLFVLGAGELFWVAVAAVFAGVTVLATGRVVLLHGAARFGVASPGGSAAAMPGQLVLVPLALAGWVIAFALAASIHGIGDDPDWPGQAGWLLAAGLGGALAAIVLVWALDVARFLLAEPRPVAPEAPDATGAAPASSAPDLVAPAWTVPRFVHETRVRLPRMDLSRRLEAQAGGRDRLPGYLDPATGALLPGHVYALLVFAALAVLYLVGFLLDAPDSEVGSRVPALVYLLALLTLPAWPLGGAAFVLDRHRVPVLVVPAALLAMAFVAPTDHLFEVLPGVAAEQAAATQAQRTVAMAQAGDPMAPMVPPGARPGDLVRRLEGCRLTVVAASGGGIRAAGWAARVLTGLQRDVPGFTPSLRLVSAVSGGSVGTMYFVAAFRDRRGPPEAELEPIVDLAMRSSLNDVAWGFAYPDLWRTFTPFVLETATDRAWALEQAWARDWPHGEATMRQWRDAAAAGERPAVAFNATIVETGQRLAIATFDRPSTGMQTWTFQDAYDTRDIRVTTAARLSATFTYVTPVARARDETAAKWHVADGGYQDNYGVATLVDWLNAALIEPPTEPVDAGGRPCGDRLRVAVVRIASTEPVREATSRSWAFQMGAPMQVLLAIRTEGPRSRNTMELDMLASAGLGSRLGVFCFDYANPDSPLSWHLSEAQRERIREAWTTEDNRAAAQRLRQFFEGDGRQAWRC